MRIKTHIIDKEKNLGRITIYPFGPNDLFTEIAVTKNESMVGNSKISIVINWPAIGDTDAKTTNTFANCLIFAANLAEEWDTELQKNLIKFLELTDKEEKAYWNKKNRKNHE